MPEKSTPTELAEERWRFWLGAILALGLAGTLAELILLEHMEGFWQNLPLYVVGLSLLALALAAWRPHRVGVRALQLFMVLLFVTGCAGLVLHFQGNREFELELHPEQTGWPQIWAILKGATPALAPGMLLVLGFLGLLWAHQHPSLTARSLAGSNQTD